MKIDFGAIDSGSKRRRICAFCKAEADGAVVIMLVKRAIVSHLVHYAFL